MCLGWAAVMLESRPLARTVASGQNAEVLAYLITISPMLVLIGVVFALCVYRLSQCIAGRCRVAHPVHA